jgi:hypothetical protein
MNEIKDDVAKTIKNVLETFTVQYTKAYVLSIVRFAELEAKKMPKDWQLEARPRGEEKPLKSGWLLKESVHLKKMNKRYFVFRGNYVAEYYDTEEEAKKPEKEAKSRGQLNLTGYSVNVDPNNNILVRLKKLAEKMGVDFEKLPKPKEYPPFTFEVYHPRRIAYYLQANNQEEFDAWVATFRSACWRAHGLTWDDKYHQRAFPIALQKTRWAMGRWGYSWSSGSEEQLLSELISEELEYDIMARMYSKLPAGPYFIRNKLSNWTQSTINQMVITAVKPGWAGMRKAVEALVPTIKPKIEEAVKPIFDAKEGIAAKMKDGVMSVLHPILEEHVKPHLGKIVSIIKSPMGEAFEESTKLLGEKLNRWEPKHDDLSKTFWDLDYFARSYWELRPAMVLTQRMYEPLWALNIIFKDIWPWHLVWRAQDYIYKHTDKAVYTFEKNVIAGGAGNASEIREEVLAKYVHDTNLAVVKLYAEILKRIVMPGFEALLIPACAAAIAPLAEAVPQPLREFIDINQMFEDLYNGVIDDSIQIVLE